MQISQRRLRPAGFARQFSVGNHNPATESTGRWLPRNVLHCAASLLSALLLLAAGGAHGGPQMLIPGISNVTPTGAFTYTVPIQIPPGTAGMVPKLALQYSSQNGDGYEGLGWTLSGLPAITRCPATISADGTHGAVAYNSNDRLCFMGQELMLAPGSAAYGTDGATYKTRIDSFYRIVEHGAIMDTSPAPWFEADEASGRVLKLGDTPNSAVQVVGKNYIRTWLLDTITDKKGNYFAVTYNTSGSTDRTSYGEGYPTRIDFTGNAAAGVSTYNSVQFFYEARPDTTPTYEAGHLIQVTKRLNEIKTYTASSLVLDYKLAYDAAAAHSRLASLTLCDTTTTNCLPQMTFTWQGGGTLSIGHATNNVNQGFGLIGADVDGDGWMDAIALPSDISGTCPTGNAISLGSSSGFSSASITTTYQYALIGDQGHNNNTYNSAACFKVQPYFGDFTGDGLPDVILSDMSWFYAQGDGQWETHNFPDALVNNQGASISETGYDINHSQFSTFGDFDGDGRMDGLSQDATNGTPYFSTGAGAWPFQAGTAVSGLGANYKLYPGDYDGDGCTDILAQYIGQGGTNQIYSFCNSAARVTVSNYSNSGTVVPGDFNGDGKTDILVLGSSSATIYLSTGTGFDAGHAVTGSSSWNSYNVVVGDWDGDGKQDVALISKATGSNLQNYLYVSKGTDFTQIGSVTTNSSKAMAGAVADWNGDGADDLWLTSTGAGDNNVLVTFSSPNATTVQPELMTSVNNTGLSTAAVTAYYYPLNLNGGFYTKGSGATYPTADLDGAYYVVGNVYYDNGLGHTHRFHYSYTGLKADLTAPPAGVPKTNPLSSGLLSFSKIQKTDYVNGIVTTTNYRTDIPYVGLVSSETVVDGSVTLSSVTNSYSTSDRQGGSTFPHLTKSVIDRTDLNGSTFPEVTNNYTWDDDGNLQILTTSFPGADPNGHPDMFTTTNTLTNDETNWILGQLTERDIRKIVYYSDGTYSDITRHFSFTPDAATGLTTDAYVEKNVNTCNAGTDSCQLHAAYTLDSFGNRTQTTLSGSGIGTRSSTMTPDANGEFPAAFSDFATHAYQASYDARFGVLSTLVDPNNVKTETDYDTFGRPQTRVAGRVNGTGPLNQGAIAYTYCSNPTLPAGESCPTYAAFAEIITPQHVSGGTTQNGAIAVTFYDSLGRVVANDMQGFGGSWTRTSVSYDNSGNVSQTSRPYFIGGTIAWTLFARDDLGRVTTETFPDQSTTTFCYAGLITSSTNADGQITTTVRNVEGLVASVRENAPANSQCTSSTPWTTYVYDAFGNPKSITSLQGTVTNSFDQRGRKVTMSDPDLGNWSYSYDVLDELVGQTDANGHGTSVGYDGLMRPTARTESDFASKWVYDNAANGLGLLNQACNTNPCSNVAGSYQRVLSYDTLERTSQSTLKLDGNSYSYAPTYDSNGRVYTLTYPSGFIAEYNYDAYGYLTKILDHNSQAVIWTVKSRDAELRLTQSKSGAGTNAIFTNYGFDANTDQVASVCASTSDPCLGEIENQSYTWDPIGNLLTRSDTYQGWTETACYDGYNRVTNYALGSTCTNNDEKKVIEYTAGNLARKSDICGAPDCYIYGGNGAGPEQLTSLSGVTYNGVSNPTFHYDANGNMTDGAGRSFTWMSFNRIKKLTQGATVLNWSYGAEHQRYKACANTCGGLDASTLYLYDPATGGMSERYAPVLHPVTWRDYIVADGRIVAVRMLTGSTLVWSYVVGDHLNSPTSIADTATPPNVERDSYDAWGKRRNADATDDSGCTLSSQLPRGYTGHEMLDQLCLINMNARLYDPGLGIFLQADTVVPNPYGFSGYMRYSYVGNNPLAFVDPSGHEDCPADECVTVTGYRGRDQDNRYDGGSYIGSIVTARSEMGPGDGRGRNTDCYANGQGGFVDGQGNECVVVTATPPVLATIPFPTFLQISSELQCSLVGLGNDLEDWSAQTGNASGAMELGGLGVSALGIVTWQAGIFAGGVAMMDAGGLMGIGAGALQIGGGLLQGFGGAGFSNAWSGIATLGTGAMLAGMANAAARTANTAGGRAVNQFLYNSRIWSGATFDILTSNIKGLAPQQKQCSAN